ncbi:armadillo-type protein [Kalaharituber pfeilii]|nr:armadillo-type protein [Kalaharituber pfeilii]
MSATKPPVKVDPNASLQDVETKATFLAACALELYSQNKLNDALRNLKHALSLSPCNPEALLAFNTIQEDSKIPEVVRLCRRALVSKDPNAAADAIQFLHSSARGGGLTGEGECLEMFLTEQLTEDVDFGLRGKIVAGLLRSTGGAIEARQVLARKVLAASEKGNKELDEMLQKFWRWGRAATEGFVSVLADDRLREKGTEKEWEKTVRLCFRWYVGRIEEGRGKKSPTDVAIAVRAISRLLVAAPEQVHHLVNHAAFEEILLAISRGRNSEQTDARETATHATLAASKYISASGTPGETLLAEFMTQRLVVSGTDEDTVIAMEAAAAIFPLIQQVAARMFTETEGFVGRLVEVLEEGERVDGSVSKGAVRAVVNLLCVACGDKACREVVKESCGDYLERIVSRGSSGGRKGNEMMTLAAVALAKIRSAGSGGTTINPTAPITSTADKEPMDSLAKIFKSSLLLQSCAAAAAVAHQESIEGLAYTSLNPSVKQSLASDRSFLNALFTTLTSSTTPTQGVIFGGLTVLVNIAAYPPALTEEQKKVLQLKKYAEANPNAPKDTSDEVDPLETDDAITARCKKLIDAGVVPVLVSIYKNLSQASSAESGSSTSESPPPSTPSSSSSLLLLPALLLSLSKSQKHRPQIAQQGGVKLLIQIYTSIVPSITTNKPNADFPTSSSAATDSNRASAIRHLTSHALARILVSVNPALVFSSQTPAASAIRPLLSLLTTRYDDDDGGARAAAATIPGAAGGNTKATDLLPLFEALLALTNLASVSPESGIQDLIVRVGWDMLEDVMLMYSPRAPPENDEDDDAPVPTHDTADATTRIQRATVELVCNLCGSGSSHVLERFGVPTTTPRAQQRIHLLLALSNAHDYGTRRAAAGALATLTEFESVVEVVLDKETGLKTVLGMLRDEDDARGEMALRGVVCVKNVLKVGGGRAKRGILKEGGKEALVEAVRRAGSREVVEMGVEAVKKLV